MENNNNFKKSYNNRPDSLPLNINAEIYNPKIQIRNYLDNAKKREISSYKQYFLIDDKVNFKTQSLINNTMVIKLTHYFLQYSKIHNNYNETHLHFKNFLFRETEVNSLLLNIDDRELLIIYLKQLSLILKKISVFLTPSIKKRNCIIGNYKLYQLILDTFWNNINWQDIFPSMPSIAKRLKEKRKIMIELILQQKPKFRIDKISNEFFSKIDSSRINNLLAISFLDFYFFTWLSHFGILKYIYGKDSNPVMVEITQHGCKILNYLLSTTS